jgi:hypothetical protein
MFLWNYALRHVPASAAALYFNLIPLVGLGFALLAGEPVGVAQLLGGSFAVAGVLLGDAAGPRRCREGCKIDTLFVVGDSETVMRDSTPMILDPLAGHPDGTKCITDPNMHGTIKELAQLDGRSWSPTRA